MMFLRFWAWALLFAILGKFGEPLAWETEPGDAIAFHGRTIHGAPGNTGLLRHRRVLSLRWVGEVREYPDDYLDIKLDIRN